MENTRETRPAQGALPDLAKKALCLALLLCATASGAFAQTYFGGGTTFGLEPGQAIPQSFSASLQQTRRWGASFGGFSLTWISLERELEGSVGRVNGILGGPQFGFWPMGAVSFYAGAGIGARFGDRAEGEGWFAWKVDGGLIVWLFDRAYVQGGMSYDNVRSGWSAYVGAGLKVGDAGRRQGWPTAYCPCE